MFRIRHLTLLTLTGLAACGQQAPAPVVFGHRGELPAVAPGTPPPQMQTQRGTGSPTGANPQASPQGVVQMQQLGPPPGSPSPVTRPQPVQQQPTQAPAPAAISSNFDDAVIVQPGDTVYALSRRYNRPVRAIIEDNNLQPPYALQPGQRINLPQGRFHTVQRGETLYSISRGTGVDLYSLAQANDLQPPFGISIGQQLKIPSPTGYAVASAPAPESPGAPQAPAPRGYQVDTLPVTPGAPVAAPVQSEEPGSAGLPPVPRQPAPERPAPQAQPEPKVASAPPSSAGPTADPKQDTVLPPRSGRTFSWPVRGRVLAGFGPTPDGLHNDGINISARAGAPVIAAENGVVVYAGSELKGFGNLLLVRHADGWMTAYAHLDKALVKKGQKVTKGQAIGTVGSTGGVSQPQLHFEIRRGTQAVDPAKFLSVA